MHKTTRHFFELVRVDILLNEVLDPFIKGIKVSPEADPISFISDRVVASYEQLVYNTINLVGAGSQLDLMVECVKVISIIEPSHIFIFF